MYTLGCYVPAPNDATSWYRAWGPLRYCRDLEGGLEILQLDPSKNNNWSDLVRCDAIFLQRPAIDAGTLLPLLDMIKQLYIPLWIDFDDYIFEVDPWHPSAHKFNNRHSQEVVIRSLEEASLITVSTHKLIEAYEKLAPSAEYHLIPNCWESRNIVEASKPKSEELNIVWRGGKSHGFDLALGSDFFLKLPERSTMTFLGHCPESTFFAKTPIAVIQEHQFVPYFLRTLSSLYPDFVVVPLVDNLFSRCKSDIAYLEATMCGALCIAPAWEPWISDKNCLCYNPELPFAAQARDFVEEYRDPMKRSEAVAQAKNYVIEHRLSSGAVATQRKNLIEGLLIPF